MFYADSESIGLVGAMMTVQAALGDEDVRVDHVWCQPARKTLLRLEEIHDVGYVVFNGTHESFHFNRTYNVLRLLPPGEVPTVEGWLSVERAARFGVCLKPRHVLDLWLVAKRGPAQSFMDRKDVYVRRVPEVLAGPLAQELRERVEIPEAYFSRRKDGYQWTVVKDEEAPEWADVVLRWGASSGLGALCSHLGVGKKLEMEIEHPDQHEWNPCAGDWKDLVVEHRDFWLGAGDAYARRDVELLKGLRKVLGNPEPDDDDSVLAASVGACRWRGWSIQRALAEEEFSKAQIRAQKTDTNPHVVLPTLKKLAGPVRSIAIPDTTDSTLEAVQSWGGEVGSYAADVRDARSAEKDGDYVRKLLVAERAHFDFSVIGTLSGRMAGRGGVSGHQAPATLRGIFDLASPGLVADGGDFASFEPSIQAAIYQDAALTALMKSGKKIHALYGAMILDEDYEDVKSNPKQYLKSKIGFLARTYGAQDEKEASVFGIPVETYRERDANFLAQFKGIEAEKKRVYEKFCSMRQPGGIGTAVEWHEPADFEESLLGFRRYFTLENRLSRATFDLARNPPREWLALEGRVSRRKGRIQTPGGAVQSALYAAAFNVQAKNLRAAGNHRIQSTGATICKRLQRRIWDHQPFGVHRWVVQPFNIHDEVLCPRDSGLDLTSTVREVVDYYKPQIPLLGMEWKRGMGSWKEKG